MDFCKNNSQVKINDYTSIISQSNSCISKQKTKNADPLINQKLLDIEKLKAETELKRQKRIQELELKQKQLEEEEKLEKQKQIEEIQLKKKQFRENQLKFQKKRHNQQQEIVNKVNNMSDFSYERFVEEMQKQKRDVSKLTDVDYKQYLDNIKQQTKLQQLERVNTLTNESFINKIEKQQKQKQILNTFKVNQKEKFQQLSQNNQDLLKSATRLLGFNGKVNSQYQNSNLVTIDFKQNINKDGLKQKGVNTKLQNNTKIQQSPQQNLTISMLKSPNLQKQNQQGQNQQNLKQSKIQQHIFSPELKNQQLNAINSQQQVKTKNPKVKSSQLQSSFTKQNSNKDKPNSEQNNKFKEKAMQINLELDIDQQKFLERQKQHLLQKQQNYLKKQEQQANSQQQQLDKSPKAQNNAQPRYALKNIKNKIEQNQLQLNKFQQTPPQQIQQIEDALDSPGRQLNEIVKVQFHKNYIKQNTDVSDVFRLNKSFELQNKDGNMVQCREMVVQTDFSALLNEVPELVKQFVVKYDIGSLVNGRRRRTNHVYPNQSK